MPKPTPMRVGCWYLLCRRAIDTITSCDIHFPNTAGYWLSSPPHSKVA